MYSSLQTNHLSSRGKRQATNHISAPFATRPAPALYSTRHYNSCMLRHYSKFLRTASKRTSTANCGNANNRGSGGVAARACTAIQPDDCTQRGARPTRPARRPRSRRRRWPPAHSTIGRWRAMNSSCLGRRGRTNNMSGSAAPHGDDIFLFFLGGKVPVMRTDDAESRVPTLHCRGRLSATPRAAPRKNTRTRGGQRRQATPQSARCPAPAPARACP